MKKGEGGECSANADQVVPPGWERKELSAHLAPALDLARLRLPRPIPRQSERASLSRGQGEGEERLDCGMR